MARLLTFLVAGFVDSSEVLEGLGEARAGSVHGAYRELTKRAVAAAGGREVESGVDGSTITFETPSSAVACAVDMQRAFDRHNATHGQRLDVRMGIEVGEAADEPERPAVPCPPAVCAKRLCESALGGQILVSNLVAALASPPGGSSFRTLGLVQLQGFPEPTATFEVWYERGLPARPPLPPELVAAPRRRSPFVGRRDERDLLRAGWRVAAAGERRLVFLAGEPGIGKTRLAAEFAHEAYDHGAIVLWGRSFEEALVPYQPFVQALRHYVSHTDPDELRQLLGNDAAAFARLLPEVRPHLPHTPELPDGGGESERYQLFEAVGSLMLGASTTAPVLLVLDDLQWADQATLLLLRHLAVDPRPASLLVLGTYRDSEVRRSHPLAQLQADVERDRQVERVGLDGLAEADVATLVDSLLGRAPSAALTRSLRRTTDGNPFFLEEMVGHLECLGLLGGEGEAGLAVEPEALCVPARVKELVARRVQRLSPPALETLRVASVIGSEFGVDVLAPVLGGDEHRVIERLDEAVEAHVLVEVPERIGRYGFSHALIQQALYEEQTTNRRASLHGQIAEALERLPERAAVVAELARHVAASGRSPAKVVRYGRAAGEQALALLAYEDATREFRRALDVLGVAAPADENARAELLVLLGLAQTRTGDAPAARESFGEAARTAARLGAAETLARAALGYGGTAGFGGVWETFAGVDEPLVGFLEDALRCSSDGETPTRVRLLGRLAQALYWEPEQARADALSREALAAARRIGDPTALAYALDSRHVALWGPDLLAERRRLAEEMLRIGDALGDHDIRLEAYAWLITDALESDPIEVVDRFVEGHARVAEELRQPYHLWYTEAARTMRAQLDGRFEEAARLAEKAWSHGEQAHGENARQTYLVQTLFLQLELGRLHELIDGLAVYVAESPLPAWNAALALAYAGLDRRDEALRKVELFAADEFRAISRNCIWTATVSMLARVVGRFGAERFAGPLYELLLPYRDRVGVVGGGVLCLGPISRLLGMLARAFGDYDGALEHLGHALASARALHAPPLVARTQVETAKVLLARRAAGDRVRAEALLEQAASAAGELGMAKLAADISGLQAGARTGRSPVPAAP